MAGWQGYTLLGRVAEQGHSRVWKARDDVLGRDVAIKELLAASPGERAELLEQWRNEARVLAALDHPNIVAVYHLQEDAEVAIVEEWVDGATVAAVLRRHGRLESQQAMAVVRGALTGLAYAHDRGVLHGDVSPSNVIIDTSGESRLIDFGLARGASMSSSSSGGTPAFRAPEVASGAATAASDVYSAAAVLAALLRGGVTAAPTTDGIAQPVRDVLDKALDTEPARRYPDAGAFLAALEEAARARYGTAWWTKAGLGALAGSATSALLAHEVLPTERGPAGGRSTGREGTSQTSGAPSHPSRRVVTLSAAGLTAALLVGGVTYVVTQKTAKDGGDTAVGSAAAGALAAAAGRTTTTTVPARPADWPGAYTTRRVLTKVTGGFFDSGTFKVGQATETKGFTLTAQCSAGPCDLSVRSDGAGAPVTLTYIGGTWHLSQPGTTQCGVPGQKLSKDTTKYTDELVLTSGPWTDHTPPTLTGTETRVYAPCKGSTKPSSLTYSVTVTPVGG